MTAAIIIGVAATVVALLGLLGQQAEQRALPSQVVVLALPLAIIAPGAATYYGMTLWWGLLAVVAVFLAVVAGTVLGRPVALDDSVNRPAAAGLSLVFSGLIALGLAVIVVVWASHLINSFSYLNGAVVSLVITAAAVAYGLGGRSIARLSRLALVLAILAAVGIAVAGYLVGDYGGLTSPLVPVPEVPVGQGLLYAVGVVLIGAGFPVLRVASHDNRRAGVVGGVILALILLVYLLGMMAIYGGGYQLPSLVINVFAVFLPPLAASVICGLVTIVAVVVAGTCIAAASETAAAIVPRWYADTATHPGPRRWVGAAMGVAVLVVSLLRPSPAAVVGVLAVLGLANLIAERFLSRRLKPVDVEPPASVGSAP